MSGIQQFGEALILLACVGCGVVGGVFFAFSNFVMKALARLPTPQGIAAMQAINIVVINPFFLGTFFGTGAVCALAMLNALGLPDGARVVWLALGALCYLIGTLGVTLACNVPNNRRLAELDPFSEKAGTDWRRYIRVWCFWNHVRTAAAVVAATSFGAALGG